MRTGDIGQLPEMPFGLGLDDAKLSRYRNGLTERVDATSGMLRNIFKEELKSVDAEIERRKTHE